MAKHNVPGLKASTGMKGFPTLPSGDYRLLCTKGEVKAPKNPEPVDVFTFTFDILDGPPMPDGKPTKGQKYTARIRILQEEHPQYEQDDKGNPTGVAAIGVGELKDLTLAAGVTFRGDDIDPTAFEGTTVVATIAMTPDKHDPAKFWNNVRAWKAA